MKNLKLFVFALISFMFIGLVNVNAETINSLDELKNCLSSNDVVCTLNKSIELDDSIISSGKNVVLDLNGKTLSLDVDTYENALIVVLHGSDLTIKDSSANQLGKISYITDLVNTNVRTAIKMTKSGGDNKLVAKLVVESGTIEGDSYAISGNGLDKRDNTLVIINGGKLYSKGTAIFQPQDGELIINDGDIEGKKVGVEIRSGKLTVNGGVINGIDKPTVSDKNSNGTTTSGAGIAIAQHTTVKDVDVAIKGGTIKGYTPFYQVTPETNSNIEKIKLSITGGNFEITNDGENVVYSEDKVNFVNGGTFNNFVTGQYIAPDAKITVKLNKDIRLNDVVVIDRDTTIDLNGHNIIQNKEKTNVFNIVSGDVEFIGKGKIISHETASSAIRILGSENREDKNFTNVTIGENVTVESNGYAAFISYVSGYKAYGVNVDIYGTLKGGYSGFYVNGSIQDSDGNFTNFPVISIHDGAKIEGVYAGGYATWNIGVATIENEGFGLGVKAGKFVIDGATIAATGEKAEPTGNGDGMNHSGAAIQFETNKGYADHIDVIIKNANVSSKNGYAFLEYLGQTEILNLKIENGTFKSATGLDVFKVSDSFNLKGFITGGTYSSDVKNYVKTGYKSYLSNGNYLVAEVFEVLNFGGKNGTLTFDKDSAAVGETVTMTITPDAGYEISLIKIIDKDNKIIEVKDNKFVMPGSDVWVSVEFAKPSIKTELPVVDPEEEVKEATVAVKEETKVEEVLTETIKENEELKEISEKESVKVEVEITNIEVKEETEEAMKEVAGNAKIATYFDIIINVKKVSDNTILGTLSKLVKEIELMVVLPEDLKNNDKNVEREYFIIREHEENGKTEVEKIPATLSEDGNYLVFKTDRFSTYALAYEDSAAKPEVPGTGDNAMLYIALGFISIAAIGVSLNSLKRRTNR